jgi:phosphopantothenoylcysteine decarboxylase/phosphopantothenate--cysteine ligase
MGYAIAEAAVAAGHEVVLVSGPVALKPPKGVEVVQVTSAAEMALAARRAFVGADAAVFAAAVCDYRPVRRASRKLPKMGRRFALNLAPTVDIAAALGRVKGRRVTIAFALEDHDARRHAEAKMLRKKSDAIVLNGPGTVGSELIRLEYLQRGGRWKQWGTVDKRSAARRLVHVLERLARRANPPPARRSPR